MTTTRTFHVKRLSTGRWTAVEYTGSARIPTTLVCYSSNDAQAQVDSIKAQQNKGLLPADAEIIVHAI